MIRALLVLTTIASLLACPLRCTSASTDGDGHKVTCQCCHKHQPTKNNAPSAPDENGGGNCLCHGAIVLLDAPADLVHQHVQLLPLPPRQEVNDQGIRPLEAYCALQFRPPSDGKLIRLRLASLLL